MAEIDAEVDAAIARHTAGATVEEFIPVLVEREVKEYFGGHRIHVRFSAGSIGSPHARKPNSTYLPY